MRVAAHHIPGTAEHRLSEVLGRSLYPEFVPTCPWPDDCMVQWGNGLVPATPFFEAFPPGTFIRGEGNTIAEAERKAFAQYQSELACDHLWGRQRPGRQLYLNGGAWCRKCGAFRGKMFREVVVLGHWRSHLTTWEADWLHSLETDQELNEHMDRKYPAEALSRRRSMRLLQLRSRLFGADGRSLA